MIPYEPTIGVCLATYHRPDGLAAVLAGIARQRLPEAVGERLVVFVADNDSAGSAEVVVERGRTELALDIRYRVEPRPGVVHARNASVSDALASGVDVVVFIDDDEVPHEDWLSELLATQRSTGAPIVGGPVAEIVDALPEWYGRTGFYRPPRLADGAPAPYAPCGNALFAAAVLASVDGPFDERFNTSGGEDVYLSLCLVKAGASIVWSPRAKVDTVVPLERASLRHVARRHYIGAANYTRAERMIEGPRGARLLTGLVRVGAGCLVALAGAVTLARHRAARGLVDAAEGAGVISGALGRGQGAAWWS